MKRKATEPPLGVTADIPADDVGKTQGHGGAMLPTADDVEALSLKELAAKVKALPASDSNRAYYLDAYMARMKGKITSLGGQPEMPGPRK